MIWYLDIYFYSNRQIKIKKIKKGTKTCRRTKTFGCVSLILQLLKPVWTSYNCWVFMVLWITAYSQYSTIRWPPAVTRGQTVWPSVDCASMADGWHQPRDLVGNHWLWYHNISPEENKSFKMNYSGQRTVK